MADETATKKKLGPVSRDERARYRARLANDADRGRPETATAEKLCSVLGVDPLSLRVPRENDAGRVAGQAFVVALDTIISLGDRGKRLTRNTLFDALARYWSIRYRRARLRGARISYDMQRSTFRQASRELLMAGVNEEALWDLLVSQVEVVAKQRVSPHPGLAQLYTLRRASGRGHAGGGIVELRDGPLLDEVRYAILRDAQYRRPLHWRLLLADEHASPLPTRHETCQERPYDEVQTGARSREVIAILEAPRIRFHVEQFREDFEMIEEFLATHLPQTSHQRYGRKAVQSTLNGFRSVYEQAAGIGGVQRDADGRAYVRIRSRFFVALNRRFHAHDFWPEHVPSELRERWFSPDDMSAYGLIVDDRDPDRLIEVGGTWTQQFVERDISSSHTQLRAAFLDLPALEALAGSKDPKFGVWLTEQLWALHERDDVLAPDYAGPSDKRLIEFMKAMWLRWNYGGKFGRTVQDLADDRETYGPGWNSNVFATGGVQRAEQFWRAFLATLPSEWAPALTTFLDACQYIGRHAHPKRGLVLTAPLEGALVQWNPIGRAPLMVPIGRHHLEMRACGVLAKVGKQKKFIPRWRVNLGELSNRVAPCLVHMMDAYFNSLVLEYLKRAGIDQIYAVHDGWFVPEHVETDLYDDDGVRLSGKQVLAHAIEDVGQEWLSGVGPDKPPDATRPGLVVVYDWFVKALMGTEYEGFAVEVRDRWRRRVAEKRWPHFTAS